MSRRASGPGALFRVIFPGKPVTALGLTWRLSLFLLIVALLGWANLPQPDVILSISARSKTFAYRVTDKRAASMALKNVQLVQNRLENLDTPGHLCLSGRVVPQKGSVVRYRLLDSGAISIAFEGLEPDSKAAIIEKENGGIETVRALDVLLLDARAQTCPARLPKTIPVWGPGSIGQLRSFGTGLVHEPGELVGGQVRITARAIERLFGVIPGAKGLYDAGLVAIPASAMLRSAVPPGNSGTSAPAADWIGAAWLVSAGGFAGFQVDVSTESDRVLLYRAGLGPASRPDSIGASAFVSQTRDPGVLGLQIGLAMFLIIIQTVAAVMQTVKTGSPRPEARRRKAAASWIRMRKK